MYKKPGFILLIIPLLIFFIIQLFTYSDYGMSWDEPTQIHLAKQTIGYISGNKPNLEFQVPDLKYYGSFFEVLNYHIASIALTLFSISSISAFHLGIVGISFLGIYFLFKLAQILFNNRVAFFSTIFLVFFPFFIAHSHYNSKDIPIAVFTIGIFYFLVKLMKEGKRKHAVFAGILFGFCLATLVTSILIIPITIISCVSYALYAKVSKEELASHISNFLVMLLSAVVTVYVAWPVLWKNPMHFFNSFYYFLNHGWTGSVQYFNTIFLAKNLPWHYSLTYIFISLPFFTFLFLAIGIFILLRFFKQKKYILESFLLFFWFIIPIILTMIPGIIKYDGLRHIFIAIPPLLIIAGVGIDQILTLIKNKQKKNYPFISTVFIFIVLSSLIWESYSIHPYQGSYVNEIGRLLIPAPLEKNIELEYWGVTYKEGVDWLNNNAKANAIICVPIASHLIQAYPIRRDISFTCKDANYIMIIARYAYIPKDLSAVFSYEKLKPVYTIDIYNSHLLYIYEKPIFNN